MFPISARNLTEEEKKGYREMRWDDKEVCGPFMLKFCPHDLFVNTKSDLGILSFLTAIVLDFVEMCGFLFLFFVSGPCPKVHDLKLKERYGLFLVTLLGFVRVCVYRDILIVFGEINAAGDV